MPSQDEQMILEDLKSFPDQNLTWERRHVILENIQKERRLLHKQTKRRKYLWVANGLIACAALFAFISIKPLFSPVDTSGSKTLTDQTYVAAAQKEITWLGINRTFQFKEIQKEKDSFIVQTISGSEMVNEWAIVTFKPNTTEVRSVSVTSTIDALPDDYQKYVKTARNAFKEANQHVTFQNFNLFKQNTKAILSFHLEDNQFVAVDLKTNKVTHYSINYNPNDVDTKFVSNAQRALNIVSNKHNLSFTQANKSSIPSSKEEIWTLSNKPTTLPNGSGNYSVQIGAESGQLYGVSYKMDRYKIKSIDEAIPVTKSLIKNVFGIDITGYKAYGGKGWGGYVYKSPGKPNVAVHMSDINSGNIGSIEIQWEQ